MAKEVTYELTNKPPKDSGSIIAGYVAPDPPAGDPYTAGHFNTLVVPVEYKLELRLGDFDDLHDKEPTDKEGQKSRLQTLALFSRPLKNAKSDDCHTSCWKYYKDVIHKAQLDPIAQAPQKETKAQQLLVEDLQKFIVDGGKLPEPKSFRKFRLPGTYYYFLPGEAGFQMADDRHAAEVKYFTDNQMLGKVPIVARVSKRIAGGAWEDAPGVTVYFQLQKPDALPGSGGIKAPALRSTQEARRLKESLVRVKNEVQTMSTSMGTWLTNKTNFEAQITAEADPTTKANMQTQLDTWLADMVNNAGREFVAKGWGDWLQGLDQLAGLKRQAEGIKNAYGNPAAASIETKMTEATAAAVSLAAALPPTALARRPYLATQKGFVDTVLTKLNESIVLADQLIASGAANAGPGGYIKKRKDDYKPSPADDPQVDNAHLDMGGKRQMAGAGAQVWGPENLFSTDSTKGFNEPQPGRTLPHKPFPVAQPAAPIGDSHKWAVRALTNDDGQAGVIFKPSHVGGDRYKLRAYIGPPTLESDGTEPYAIVVNTGTLVVWRALRLSRYIRQVSPGAGGASQTIKDEIVTPYGSKGIDAFHQGTPSVIDFDTGVRREYEKCYCEFIIDPLAKNAQEMDAITDIDKVHQKAIADAKSKAAGAGINYDIDKLLYYTKKTPYTVNIHMPENYNAQVGGPQQLGFTKTVLGNGNVVFTIDGTTNTNLRRVTRFYLDSLLLNIDGNGGFWPGLILFQAPQGDTYSAVVRGVAFTTSGIGLGPGCYVWYGREYNNVGSGKFPYGLTSNTTHELGHCQYRPHAPISSPTGGDDATKHDPADVCVMSYVYCDGQYCGNCVGQFMGFDSNGALFRAG